LTTAWALRHDRADQLSELEEALGGVSQKKESWHYDRAGNLASTVNTPAGQTGTLQMRTHTGRNQLTQLGGTGKTLVEGTTNEAATVKVNGQPAQVTKLGPSGPWRFQKEMDFPSGTTSITVEAKDGANNVRTNTYNVNVAASGAQTLEYDANGNLLAVKDSANVVLRSYEWDASNRLLAIQIPGAVAAGTKRTEFVYDGAGRRVRQLDKEHNGSAWTTQSHWYYLWDGLELAQKRDVSTGNVLANYFANGEQQGANSLVYLSDHLGSPRSWYRVSDGAVGSADYSAYGVSGSNEVEWGSDPTTKLTYHPTARTRRKIHRLATLTPMVIQPRRLKWSSEPFGPAAMILPPIAAVMPEARSRAQPTRLM
jgi:YD repeat-containing protein